jgi:hypothetical protein
VIDGLQMMKRAVARIDFGRKSFLLCRQSETEWTLSYDRWGTGVRQFSAAITLRDTAGERVWTVVAMPGKRHPREVETWSIAIDAALKIR